jgi:hypothetical protein
MLFVLMTKGVVCYYRNGELDVVDDPRADFSTSSRGGEFPQREPGLTPPSL